jgi:hypothetical protein
VTASRAERNIAKILKIAGRRRERSPDYPADEDVEARYLEARAAAVELRAARKTATQAAVPRSLLARTFEAELALIDARATGDKPAL